MKLLLDTHALLWALTMPNRLPPRARRLLLAGTNDVYVSAASIFEIAAKYSVARRNSPGVDGAETVGLAKQAGYEFLSVTIEHAAACATLAPYHADPFDRLLLAQAQVEGLRLVTHDEALAAYDSRTILF
jgi:PIN domain nuclease of toxin-antitoxin system